MILSQNTNYLFLVINRYPLESQHQKNDVREVAMSLTHLANITDGKNGSVASQPNSLVSSASHNKPLGTLQRLARSSSNLISRSKSCLTIESLHKFKKSVVKFDKKVPFEKKEDELLKNNKVSSSNGRLDNFNSSEVFINPNTNDSLNNGKDIVFNKKQATTIENIRDSNLKKSLQSSEKPLIFSTACLNDNGNDLSISPSLKSSKQKKTLKRNPSMLYYANKLSIKPNEISKEALNSSEDNMNNSSGGELVLDSNKLLGDNLLIEDQSERLVNGKCVDSGKSMNVEGHGKSVNSAKPLTNYLYGKSSGSGIDPQRYHGPEFVIRSKLPATVLDDECNMQSHKQRGRVCIILLTGERLHLHPNTANATIETIAKLSCDHCHVPSSLQSLFGLAVLQHGEFYYPPTHTKLHKLAPKDWQKKSKTDEVSELTLYFRLAYYHR